MINRFAKFTLLINTINRYINKIKSEEMREFDLKSYHVSCLFYLNIYKEKGLTASELCNLCEEDKGTISRSLSYLQDREYIYIQEDLTKKKYRTKLFLTDSGKEISKKITKLTDDAVNKVSFGISDKERAILYKLLESIANNLKDICDNYGDKYGN